MIMRRDWTDDEMILALALYFKLPYSRLNKNTQEVKDLATLIGRSNNSVAIRLVNYAACDPALTSKGKVGMYAGIPKCLPFWEKYANNKEDLFWAENIIKTKLIKGDKLRQCHLSKKTLKLKDLPQSNSASIRMPFAQ